jgi:hypothetical protein
MVLHLDTSVAHRPAKGSQRNGGPGLATTRTGSLARVMTNSPCQRGVALLKLKVHPVGISEVSRPAEGFTTGRDFARTGSGSPHPRNYIVSQQTNVEVAIHYRRRLRNRGIRSGKAKPRTQCLVCSALD